MIHSPAEVSDGYNWLARTHSRRAVRVSRRGRAGSCSPVPVVAPPSLETTAAPLSRPVSVGFWRWPRQVEFRRARLVEWTP